MSEQSEEREPSRHLTADECWDRIRKAPYGRIAVAAAGEVDVFPVNHAVDGTSIVPMEMGGRTMTGWLHVHSDAVRTDAELQAWVDRGLGHARTLPPKKPR